MNPAKFPIERWQSFRTHPMVRELACELDFKDWPSPAQWQTLVQTQASWPALCFIEEHRPGQRARRRLKKNQGTGRSYEARIIEQGEIPTRPQNLHDFFNAMIWRHFPRAKQALHTLAFQAQKQHDPSDNRRSRIADRLTCFDEGGVFLMLPEGYDQDRVQAVFASRDDVEKRKLCEELSPHFYLFGHGLLENLFLAEVSVYVSCCILKPGDQSHDHDLQHYFSDFDAGSAEHGSIDILWVWSRA